MSDIPKDIVSLLTQLLPGFFAAWVAYGLTSHAKPAQFERVVQALIYSFLIGVIVGVVGRVLTAAGEHVSLGTWDGQAELIASAITALCLGLLVAFFAHNDRFYRLSRRLRLTSRTAFPSEWFGAFSEHPRYVVLHLEDGRRISGYPVHWPSEASAGHFELFYAAWINVDGTDDIVLDGDHAILIPAKQVGIVEFLKYREELSYGAEAAEPVASTAADPAASGPSEREPAAVRAATTCLSDAGAAAAEATRELTASDEAVRASCGFLARKDGH